MVHNEIRVPAARLIKYCAARRRSKTFILVFVRVLPRTPALTVRNLAKRRCITWLCRRETERELQTSLELHGTFNASPSPFSFPSTRGHSFALPCIPFVSSSCPHLRASLFRRDTGRWLSKQGVASIISSSAGGSKFAGNFRHRVSILSSEKFSRSSID